MAQVPDTKTFQLGMNKDIDARFLKQGKYIDAQNILIDNHSNSREGVATNLQDIKAWSDTGFINRLSNDRVIGIFPDNQNEEVYIFIKTVGNSMDRIVKFNLTFVLQWDKYCYYSDIPCVKILLRSIFYMHQ